MNAYVSEFKYDVFISYAHVDDVPPTEKVDGWITKFAKTLRRLIDQQIGQKDLVKIWRDPKINGNDKFADTIDAACRNTAAMISIVSEGYIQSTWCQRELDHFGTSGRSMTLGDKSRLFRVNLAALPSDRIPAPLQGMPGYQFFSKVDEETHRLWPVDSIDGPYWSAVEKLAANICDILRQMRVVPPQIQVEDNRDSVYVAEVADDMDDQRRLVVSALRQRNVLVLPEISLNLHSPTLVADVRATLARASRSVHLVGSLPGKRSDNDPRPIVHLQWELAAEVLARDSKRMAWIPPNVSAALPPTQPDVPLGDHGAFLRNIMTPADTDIPFELLTTGFELFRQTVLSRLATPASVGREGPLVYVAYSDAEQGHVTQLREFLHREQCDVLLTRYVPPTSDQREDRLHRVNLETCDGLVLLFGQDSVWLNERAFEVRDVARQRAKRQPLRAVCIYDGPPIEKNGVAPAIGGWLVADCRDGFRPGLLAEFVSGVRGIRAA